MKDVFICYASEDKTFVEKLKKAFDKAGITFWLDESNIEFGDQIQKQISTGMKNYVLFLAVISPDFMNKDYPKNELSIAIKRFNQGLGGRVLPVLVRGFKAEDLIKIDTFLDNFQAHEWEDHNIEVFINRILNLLERPSKIKRVCMVSSEYPPHMVGGLGVHVEKLTEALINHLESIFLILPMNKGDYQQIDNRISIYPIFDNAPPSYAKASSWLWFCSFAGERIGELRPKPEVVHCHDWVTVLAGIKARWNYGIPLLFHLHLPNLFDPLCAAIENLGLICADLITVNSDYMKRALKKERPFLHKKRIEVVKNAVDIDRFKPAVDWSTPDNYLLFVGRLEEQKGVEYLIKAMPYVHLKFPTIHLKIVGKGNCRDELVSLTNDLGLSEFVKFVGEKGSQELVQLYQKAIIVLIPSIFEPFGMTALEGMACQRPVIVSNTGGLQEILQQSAAGLMVEKKDHLDLAQGIMTLLHSPDLQQQLGEAGREWIINEKYIWPEVAKIFKEKYQSLANSDLDMKLPKEGWDFIDQIKKEATRQLKGETGKIDHLFVNLFSGLSHE